MINFLVNTKLQIKRPITVFVLISCVCTFNTVIEVRFFVLLWKSIAEVETFQSQLTAGVGQLSIKNHKRVSSIPTRATRHPQLLCTKKSR